jgi:hypothetical protein
VSLRRDIKDSFDEIAPNTAGMSDRVIRSAQMDPGPARWSLRLRAPISLVAALVAIAVIAGVLVGGQVMRDWNNFRLPTPAGSRQLSPLEKLESRPLHMPAYTSITQCQSSRINANGDLGLGVFHFSASAVETQTAWGSYFHRLLFADRAVDVPILLRAQDLITRQQVVFVGEHAAGSSVGTDVVGGQSVQQRTEFVLSEAASPLAWQYTSGMPKASSGCFGWQVDTPSLSEVLVSRRY